MNHATCVNRKNQRNSLILLGCLLLIFLFPGCVTNPITGRSQFSMVGKSQLLSLSQEAVPAQFSADYGVVNDSALNAYVSQIGQKLVATLTPADMVYTDMPFNFQVVNATYVNAYAFPDGTIAVSRGMMAAMENEAQLAAVLGHEIAHVNCGHTASAISRSTLYSAIVSGTTGYLASQGSAWSDFAGQAGQLGSAMVLASYSREQEHQADQGGMEYMVRAGYDPQGMVELMQLLVKLSNTSPSALEQMFASHPMSSQRLQIATERASTQYAGRNQGVKNQAAFLAATAKLRNSKEALQQFEKAEQSLVQQKPAAAQQMAQQGLRQLPNDYMGLLLLAQAQQKQGNISGARTSATQAANSLRNGARAQSILAQCALQQRDYQRALQHLNNFDRLSPGQPETNFYRGIAYEGMGNRNLAANAYSNYMRNNTSNTPQGRYAAQRVKALSPTATTTQSTRRTLSKPNRNKQ